MCDLIQSVSSFRRKLDIFEKNIASQVFIHTSTILEYYNDTWRTLA